MDGNSILYITALVFVHQLKFISKNYYQSLTLISPNPQKPLFYSYLIQVNPKIQDEEDMICTVILIFTFNIIITIMIDLLKNYKELNNATGYMGSVRYNLAKRKLDTLFMKWLANNKQNVEDMLGKAKQQKLNASEAPMPFFPPRTNLSTTIVNASSINLGMNNTITPPRRSNQTPQAMNRKSFNETYNPSHLIKSTMLGKSLHHQIKIDTEKIPPFYYPQGKPLDPSEQVQIDTQIKLAFKKQEITNQQQISDFLQKILQLPCYFVPLFIKKHAKSKQRLTKNEFMGYWREEGVKQISKKAFNLLSTNKKYITIDDFKQLLKIVLELHPGLQFLSQTPQFQQWYSICVINRMFFIANKKNDMKMSYREFKNSNILKSLFDIQQEPEINMNRDYFCYQDFYVIYIKFWELDNTHDFFLTKEEFSKYSGYTLSRKAVQRIFSQVARKFQDPQKMTFGDFVWFIYCAEDKTTPQSIEYWFNILDLDHNGIVTGYQLEFFYEEQNQRLAYMENGSTDFNYENLICQMVDLLKPNDGLQFTLEDFLKRKKEVGVFINALTDLNKMLAYDSRDAYEERAEKTQHPDWSDWERFVKPEYKRVQSGEENQQDEEVLNWQNDQ